MLPTRACWPAVQFLAVSGGAALGICRPVHTAFARQFLWRRRARLRGFDVVVGLQIQPVLRALPKGPAQAQCHFCRDRAFPAHQLRDAHGRHPEQLGEGRLRQVQLVQDFAQKFAGVDGGQAGHAKTNATGPAISHVLDGARSFQESAVPSPVCSASAMRSRMVSAVSVRVRYRASDSVSASKV